ncbi:MAG: methyltransferase domain-containing protein [Candidatus Omnitrophica bacterium]|nr:methyltransferase domain-containing protein [Candidatus Omnitrophota bacterium]
MPAPPSGRWNRMVRKARRAVFRDEPTYYDMFENPGEKYFARLYLAQIRKAIQESPPRKGEPLQILDAGCQAGRLAVPLALDGHEVTGVDTSDLALRRARRHAGEAQVQLKLIRADLAWWLPAQPQGSFDAVLCAEVLYLRENYRQLLQDLIRVLRPGGLCFISHRPTGYYLAEALQRRDWEGARQVLEKREGKLWGSYYNWQDPEELIPLYRTVGIDPARVFPIGFFSWLAVNPEGLPPEGQELLFQADQAFANPISASGRYLLVCGRKGTA